MGIFLYNHGGSANHGCEALVRTTVSVLGLNKDAVLLSEASDEDIKYGIDNVIRVRQATHTGRHFNIPFVKAYLRLKLTGDYTPMDVLPYKNCIRSLRKGDTGISIGGDIYCYEDYTKYILIHSEIARKGCNTILLGCSLEENLFLDNKFREDLKKYNFITARESITYGYLKKAGVKNVFLIPDTAFLLPADKRSLPEGFTEGNTIGINISPLVNRKGQKNSIVLANYRRLIQYILTNTDCAVALIPHVTWKDNDDRTVLKQLYDEFGSGGRLVMLPDCGCMEIKGYISRCRLFIGARTHATIAAYSSYVPTLVAGYSVKARGIAKDLFGTCDNYVVSVQNMKTEEDLTRAFIWLWDNEERIRKMLKSTLPDYIASIDQLRNILDGWL